MRRNAWSGGIRPTPAGLRSVKGRDKARVPEGVVLPSHLVGSTGSTFFKQEASPQPIYVKYKPLASPQPIYVTISGTPGRPHGTAGGGGVAGAQVVKQFLNTQDNSRAQLRTHDTITTRSRTRNSISRL